MTTSTVQTIKEVLTKADPNEIADALRKCNLGNMFQVKMYDTGTITGVATVPLPESALHVLSARVVTSGTAASVGTYMVADNGVTPLLPPRRRFGCHRHRWRVPRHRHGNRRCHHWRHLSQHRDPRHLPVHRGC